MYLSLGDRECHVRNRALRTVEDCTRRLWDFYRSQGIESTFELNPGNHFREADVRLAKGIAWALSARFRRGMEVGSAEAVRGLDRQRGQRGRREEPRSRGDKGRQGGFLRQVPGPRGRVRRVGRPDLPVEGRGVQAREGHRRRPHTPGEAVRPPDPADGVHQVEAARPRGQDRRHQDVRRADGALRRAGRLDREELVLQGRVRRRREGRKRVPHVHARRDGPQRHRPPGLRLRRHHRAGGEGGRVGHRDQHGVVPGQVAGILREGSPGGPSGAQRVPLRCHGWPRDHTRGRLRHTLDVPVPGVPPLPASGLRHLRRPRRRQGLRPEGRFLRQGPRPALGPRHEDGDGPGPPGQEQVPPREEAEGPREARARRDGRRAAVYRLGRRPGGRVRVHRRHRPGRRP